jgi:hypothetical protein
MEFPRYFAQKNYADINQEIAQRVEMLMNQQEVT